ncbi:MAG: hypothetical protein Q9223_007977, partial [Gallowayella weberi]
EREEMRRGLRIAAGEAHARRAVEEKYSSVLDMSASLLHGASRLAIAKVDGLLELDDPNTAPVAPVMTQPKESLTTQLSILRSPKSVSVCWRKWSVCWEKSAESRKSLRFLRTTPEQHTPFRGISSTLIQEKMQELKGYRLKSALESMALSPGLLWDMLLPPQLRCDKVAYLSSHVGGPICLDNEQDLITTRPFRNGPSTAPLDPPARPPISHLHTLSYHRGTQTLDDMSLPIYDSKCLRPPNIAALLSSVGNSKNPPIINSTLVGTKRKKDIFDNGSKERDLDGQALPKKRTH